MCYLYPLKVPLRNVLLKRQPAKENLSSMFGHCWLEELPSQHSMFVCLTVTERKKKHIYIYMLYLLPGVSPGGSSFGGLTDSVLLIEDLVVLLDSVVVTTVNVLWESLVVVLVVVATVVVAALVDVKFGSVLPSSSMLSVPVGPQSINPATVVVRPSWDLS